MIRFALSLIALAALVGVFAGQYAVEARDEPTSPVMTVSKTSDVDELRERIDSLRDRVAELSDTINDALLMLEP